MSDLMNSQRHTEDSLLLSPQAEMCQHLPVAVFVEQSVIGMQREEVLAEQSIPKALSAVECQFSYPTR